MKTIKTMLLLSVICGCQTAKMNSLPPIPPCPIEFWDIANTPYVLDRYDCSNMSAHYLEILERNGYDAWILIVPAPKDERYGHAFVKVQLDDGEIIYCDPANNVVTHNIMEITSRKISDEIDYPTYIERKMDLSWFFVEYSYPKEIK